MAITEPTEFTGKQATVEVGSSISAVTSDEPLDGQMSDQVDYSGEIRDITIADPEAGVEVEDTFGGQIKAESPPDLVTIDFTFRFNDTQVFEEQHGSASTYTTNSETWTRVQGTATTGERPRRAVLFKLSRTIGGSTYKMNYLVNDAIFVQDGEISLDADGNAELTASATAKVDDRYIEKNF